MAAGDTSLSICSDALILLGAATGLRQAVSRCTRYTLIKLSLELEREERAAWSLIFHAGR